MPMNCVKYGEEMTSGGLAATYHKVRIMVLILRKGSLTLALAHIQIIILRTTIIFKII